MCALVCLGSNATKSDAVDWKKLYGICAETVFCGYALVKILQVPGSGSYITALVAAALFVPDLIFRGEQIYDEYKLEQEKTDKKALQTTKQEIKDPKST